MMCQGKNGASGRRRGCRNAAPSFVGGAAKGDWPSWASGIGSGSLKSISRGIAHPGHLVLAAEV